MKLNELNGARIADIAQDQDNGYIYHVWGWPKGTSQVRQQAELMFSFDARTTFDANGNWFEVED